MTFALIQTILNLSRWFLIHLWHSVLLETKRRVYLILVSPKADTQGDDPRKESYRSREGTGADQGYIIHYIVVNCSIVLLQISGNLCRTNTSVPILLQCDGARVFIYTPPALSFA